LEKSLVSAFAEGFPVPSKVLEALAPFQAVWLAWPGKKKQLLHQEAEIALQMPAANSAI
jgi:hypothetical protein